MQRLVESLANAPWLLHWLQWSKNNRQHRRWGHAKKKQYSVTTPPPTTYYEVQFGLVQFLCVRGLYTFVGWFDFFCPRVLRAVLLFISRKKFVGVRVNDQAMSEIDAKVNMSLGKWPESQDRRVSRDYPPWSGTAAQCPQKHKHIAKPIGSFPCAIQNGVIGKKSDRGIKNHTEISLKLIRQSYVEKK